MSFRWYYPDQVRPVFLRTAAHCDPLTGLSRNSEEESSKEETTIRLPNTRLLHNGSYLDLVDISPATGAIAFARASYNACVCYWWGRRAVGGRVRTMVKGNISKGGKKRGDMVHIGIDLALGDPFTPTSHTHNNYAHSGRVAPHRHVLMHVLLCIPLG